MSTDNKLASTRAVYTICPVLVASHIAVEKGWLAAEIKKAGGAPQYLWSLPPENWLAHFTHRRADLFRDGGNIPAIWARSRGEDTRLLGTTFASRGGQILVRVNSGLRRVADLKGRRVGLFKRVNRDRVDFWRGTAERGIESALALAGLKRKDVRIVNLPVTGPDYPSAIPAKNPAELWWSRHSDLGNNNSAYRTEINALLAGQVDAIYASHGHSRVYGADDEVTAIEDLGRHPDWTLQIANSPWTLTVSGELADQHPRVVIAYLKAVIKAGRWINKNPAEAGAIFAKVIRHWGGGNIAREIPDYDFVPNLSRRNLAALDLEKQFLLGHGYIKDDFSVSEWAAPQFLEEALGGKDKVTPAW
ncbi:MAG: ABC transporter substrate-binding protein [Verrucomicrobiales bacterium]|jgi:ABC-type nitrate/sulfonate/bicarbonate transport system substrate-binding protein|nr:ABC transporter substrate-binding protein [Verrucomicrobiales bacterium]